MKLNEVTAKVDLHEVAMWEVIEDKFCGLLWKHQPSSEAVVFEGGAIKAVLVNLDDEGSRGAMISIADHDFKPGEGLRTGLKDLKIEVFDRRITEDILVQFEAWYVRTGKHLRIILRYPWIDRMPTRYELGRVDAATGSR